MELFISKLKDCYENKVSCCYDLSIKEYYPEKL